MFPFFPRKNIYLIIFIFLFFIPFINSLLLNSNNQKIEKSASLIEEPLDMEETYNFFRKLSYTCATTSYSKSDIKEECADGPNSYDRILKYNSFIAYILKHDYHSNGLYYVTSLLVDSDTHHFGNFMNDGAGMIILYIIDGLMLLGWIPILICWRKRCCIFDDCLYANNCCILFWHILTYFLAAAIFSFLIVVLCFGE